MNKFGIVDGKFRAFKKKNNKISLNLRTYLLVYTNTGFRLSAYLKNARAWLTLPEETEIEIEELSFSDNVIRNHPGYMMVHDFWLRTVFDKQELKSCVADLKLMFHLSFNGHPIEEPEYIKRKVFIVPRF